MYSKATSLILHLWIITACSTQSPEVAQYREEVNNYCNAYSIEYWEREMGLNELNAMRPDEKQYTLSKGICATGQGNPLGLPGFSAEFSCVCDDWLS